jgi:hypothetical protein
MISKRHCLVLAALFCLLLPARPAWPQELKVSVSVEMPKGKKNKKLEKSLQQGICDVMLKLLKDRLPTMTVPETCNTEAPEAYLLARAEVTFVSEPPAMNLFLELRNLSDDSIIKQKAASIDTSSGLKGIEPKVIAETVATANELIPEGWKPHIVKQGTLKGGQPEPEPAPEPAPGPAPAPSPAPAPVPAPAPPEGAEGVEPTAAETAAPVEEPAPAGKPGLLLAVSASGAAVTIDGKLVGTSPLGILPDIQPGTHVIDVKKQGYKAHAGSVTVPDGEGTVRYDVILESKQKQKKKGGVATKWWFWTVLVVVIGGGAAGATAGAILSQKENVNAIPLPGY